MSANESIVILTGPTAVGKTELSIELAKAFHGEIVSIDAMQVYRGLDIGTAKPTLSERQGIFHHLIDMLDPDETLDASLFSKQVHQTICDIKNRGKIPFLVGGSAFYLRVFRFGLFECPDVDLNIRETLQNELISLGAAALYDRLVQIDPKRASEIHPNDKYRIVRALEIYELCGKPPSSLYAHQTFSGNAYRQLLIGLHRDREELYARINRRVEAMIQAEWIKEVQSILDAGYPPDIPALQSLGYRQIVSFLQGNLSKEEAITLIQRDTRRFAKRQLTWFRKNPDILWFHPDDSERILNTVKSFLEAVG